MRTKSEYMALLISVYNVQLVDLCMFFLIVRNVSFDFASFSFVTSNGVLHSFGSVKTNFPKTVLFQALNIILPYNTKRSIQTRSSLLRHIQLICSFTTIFSLLICHGQRRHMLFLRVMFARARFTEKYFFGGNFLLECLNRSSR